MNSAGVLAAGSAKEGVGRAALDHAAAMQEHDLAGESLGLVQIVRRHHHFDAARDDRADDIFDRFGRSRVEACGRLVEQQNLRLLGQCARERKAMLLAAGELPCRTIAEPVEADERAELAGACLAFRARHAGGRQRITDVAAGAATKHRRALEHHGAMGRCHVLAGRPRSRVRAWARTKPMMSRSRVVLPAPFGPISTVGDPAASTSEMPVEDRHAAGDEAHVFEARSADR